MFPNVSVRDDHIHGPFIVSKFRPFLVQNFQQIINMNNRTYCISGATITYPPGGPGWLNEFGSWIT